MSRGGTSRWRTYSPSFRVSALSALYIRKEEERRRTASEWKRCEDRDGRENPRWRARVYDRIQVWPSAQSLDAFGVAAWVDCSERGRERESAVGIERCGGSVGVNEPAAIKSNAFVVVDDAPARPG